MILRTLLLAVVMQLALLGSSRADVWVATNATSRYFKGTLEASMPTNAWRLPGFNDSSWWTGPGPFHFGTNSLGGDDGERGGTILSDMRSNYTCIFVRAPFVVADTNGVLTMTLRLWVDDGLVAWINGVEVRRAAVTNESYTAVASSAREANTVFAYDLSNFRSALRNGTNILAVQAFNYALANDDFRLVFGLEATSTFPPQVASVTPPPGTLVSNLTQITVQFDKAVSGVVASDFLLNGSGAQSVSGSNSIYTFVFNEPPAGPVQVRWDINHTIYDLLGSRFDENGPGAQWSYTLVDATPPLLASVLPVPTAAVSNLTQIEVAFTELISGVDSSDLLINEAVAISVVPTADGTYLFSFSSPPPGVITVRWAVGHNIRDLAPVPNNFGGGSWTYTNNVLQALGEVVINEFSTDNVNGLLDEDGQANDWLELRNRGATPVRLLGWSLTDDPSVPGKWIFPNITLGAGQYLVVFASAKDRKPTAPGSRLHTNFRLNAFGGYLGLYNANLPRHVVSEFVDYPPQRVDIAYGRTASDARVYFSTPTPGAVNPEAPVFAGMASMPEASVDSGLFNQPFTLLLSSATPGASVYYTLDGATPTTGSALYTSPIPISGSTNRPAAIVRAAAFRSNWLSSDILTRTYLFPSYVVNQASNPAGFPIIWDSPCSVPNRNCSDIVGDYEMDPQVVTSGTNAARILAGLSKLPTLSIVAPVDLLFGPAQGVWVRREDWNQQPVNVELIHPDGSPGFNVPAGLEIQGGTSPYDQGTTWKSKKLSLRLVFKGDFGAKNLDYPLFPDSAVTKFNTLVLDNGLNHVWHYNGGSSPEQQRQTAQYVRDTAVSDLQNAAGSASAHWRFVHFYLNGLYWGITGLHERPDDKWAEEYFGGDAAEYDVLRHNNGNIVAGNNTHYNQMFTVARSGAAQNSVYEQIAQQYLDLPWFIDYMIINFWAGNEDWAHQNWYATHRRLPGEGWRYVSWDAEHVMEHLTQSSVGLNNSYGPTELLQLLKLNSEFRVKFGDHVHRLFYNGGLFSIDSTNAVHLVNPTNNRPAALYLKRIHEIEGALVGESARWGDSATTAPDRSNNPLTREGDWLPELFGLMGWTNGGGNHSATFRYFPLRHATVLGQFRSVGLYPNLAAPAFSQHGGRVAPGYALHLTNVAGTGTLYYTTNGTDPRVYGSGSVSPHARAYLNGQPLVLGSTLQVKARTFLQATNWSALNEALFTVGSLAFPLRITEINYNPPGGSAYEFLELYHAGAAPLNLSGFDFEGISFLFPPNSLIEPGALIVLASIGSTNDFKTRYPGVAVFGWFNNNLNNAGDRIVLRDPTNQIVLAVNYDDAPPWPTPPDGQGPTLEIIDPNGDQDDPANWRASAVTYGTPGQWPSAPPAPEVVINELMADNLGAVNNGGTFPDWVELFNPGAAPVNLENWSLTDDGNARKYVFPAGVSLPSGGYLVVWCDTATGAPGLHTGFALDRQGDSLFLYNASTTRVDSITFGPQVTDLSLGRLGSAWQLTVPTTNAPNVAAALGSATDLVLNEWLANPLPGSSDWVEIYNRGASPVALQGVHLGASNALDQLRSLSFIPAGGFVQLFADENSGPNHLEVSLSKNGGFISLFDATGAQLDRISYAPQPENVSEGRLPNGSSAIVSFPGSLSPGASNYLASYTGPMLNEVMARNQSAVVGLDGQYTDWVEIYNPGASAFSLAGFRLSDATDEPAKFVFPPGASIAGLGYLVVWCNGSRPTATNLAAPFNSGFSLRGESGGVYLFNALGQQVNAVEYGFQVQDRSIGWSGGQWHLLSSPTPGTANASAAPLGSPLNLRVNEWMASSTNGDDWFELYNLDALPVNLAGLYLTDDPSIAGMTKFQVGPLSFIDGHGWVLWTADGQPGQGRDHVNFALNGGAESLRIYSTPNTLIDAVSYGYQTPEVSQGRLPDGGPNLVSFNTTPSPGAANYLPLTNVVINEVLAHTDPPFEDAIELHNPTASPVNLGGWYLSNSESDPKRYRFTNGAVIAPGSFRVVYEYQFNTNNGIPPSFTLNSAHGDEVLLSEADGAGNLSGYRASVAFGPSENAVSIGRYSNSVGVDFVALSARTFGVDNPPSLAQFRTGTGKTNAGPRIGPLVIHEIMYHPVTGTGSNALEGANDEFIEIANVTNVTVPLFDPAASSNRWKLGGAIEFLFPPGASLATNTYLLAVKFDPGVDAAALAAFRNRYSVNSNVAIYGPWSGRLDNAGEAVELFKPDTPQTQPPDTGFVPYVLVDRVQYDDAAPWPAGADGGGASLQRITAHQYGNEPLNWKAAAPTAGRANSGGGPAAPTIDEQPIDQIVVAGQSVTFTVVASGTPPLSYQWQFNGDDISGATASSYQIPSAQPIHQGSYRVQVSNGVGSILSQPATLTVRVPPAIDALAPSNQIVAAGSVATIVATVSGSAPLSYQWYFNGSRPLSGQESATLSLSDAQPAQSGEYHLVVTNLAGAATSGVATITVRVPPAISSQPQSQTVSAGSNAVFSVAATGDAPLGYQWSENGRPLSGATTPTLLLSAVTLSDSGKSYTVLVTNLVGNVLSAPAWLTVVVRPILLQPLPMGGGFMQFTIAGEVGQSYWLEDSADLTVWTTRTNTAYTHGQTVTVDTSGVGGSQSFYRLRVAP